MFTIEDDDNEFSPDERLKLENVFQLLAFGFRACSISIYTKALAESIINSY